MISTIHFEAVLIFVLVIVVVRLFVWVHALFNWFGFGSEYKEPFFNAPEPNRRNQSGTPSA